MVMIGQQLKKMREAKGMSQSEVANQLHISRQTISKWELDKSLPDVSYLKQLAAFFEVSLDELLAVAEERKKMLQTILPSKLVTELIKQILPKVILSPVEQEKREDFILREMVQPLGKKLGTQLTIYWVGIEKKESVPMSISASPMNEVSQAYLKLFNYDCSQFYLLTDSGIVSWDSILYFEKQEFNYYPFTKMDYLCLGAYAEVMTSSADNPNCLGIFMKDRRYTLARLSTKAGRSFAITMKQLDFTGVFYREVKRTTMLDFQKKWRRKRQLPT